MYVYRRHSDLLHMNSPMTCHRSTVLPHPMDTPCRMGCVRVCASLTHVLLAASSAQTLCCSEGWSGTPNCTTHASLYVQWTQTCFHCVQQTQNTHIVNKQARARTHTHANRSSCIQLLQYSTDSHCAFRVFDLPAPSPPPSIPAVFSPTAKFHKFIAVVCSCSAAVRCSLLSKSSDGTLLTRSSARSANADEFSPPWSAVSSFSKAAAQGERG